MGSAEQSSTVQHSMTGAKNASQNALGMVDLVLMLQLIANQAMDLKGSRVGVRVLVPRTRKLSVITATYHSAR